MSAEPTNNDAGESRGADEGEVGSNGGGAMNTNNGVPAPSSSMPLATNLASLARKQHRPGVTLTGGAGDVGLLSGIERAPRHTVLNLGGLPANREPLANLGSPTFSPEMTGTNMGEADGLNDLDLPPPASATEHEVVSGVHIYRQPSPFRPSTPGDSSRPGSTTPSRRPRGDSASTDASQSPRAMAFRVVTHDQSNASTPPRQESPNHLMNPYTSLARNLRPSNASYDEDEPDEHPLVLQLPRDLMKSTTEVYQSSTSPTRIAPARQPFRHPMYVSAVHDSFGSSGKLSRKSGSKATASGVAPVGAGAGSSSNVNEPRDPQPEDEDSDEELAFSPKSLPRGLHSRPSVRIEPWIDAGKQTDGIFLRRDVADELGLKVVGTAVSVWGVSVDRLSPIQLHLFTRHTVLTNVYLLPTPFEIHPTYGGGIISIECLWACGLSVIIESGEIFLQDSEASDVQFRGDHR